MASVAETLKQAVNGEQIWEECEEEADLIFRSVLQILAAQARIEMRRPWSEYTHD